MLLEDTTSILSYEMLSDEESSDGDNGSNFDPVRDANTLIDAIELLTTSVEVQTVEDSESVENINIHNIDGDTTENMPSINLTEVERLQAIIAMKDAEIERLSRLNTNIAPPKWDKTVPLGSHRAVFTRISKLRIGYEYSPTSTIDGTDWAICICTKTIESKKYLSLYLELLSDSKGNHFSTICSIKLLRQNGLMDSQMVTRTYKGKSDAWGFHKFILFEDLLNSSNGYVVNDSIVIEYELKVFPLNDCSRNHEVPSPTEKDHHISSIATASPNSNAEQTIKLNSMETQNDCCQIFMGFLVLIVLLAIAIGFLYVVFSPLICYVQRG